VSFASLMAEIAWGADDVEDSDDDVLSRYAFESEGVVDLLVKRKSDPPAVTEGISVESLARSARKASSRPKGVGSGGSPRMQDYEGALSRGRRSLAPLWLAVAAAIGAALIGYLFFRRETAVGSILGQLLHAAMPSPPAAKETTTDLVDVSYSGRRQSNPAAKD
jgi:hypothetical protein